MSLLRSSIHRELEFKMKIFGFEVFDLIISLIVGSVCNLFGFPTILSLFLPLTFLAILFFSKRNKPENYLKHLIKYHLTPGFYLAGEEFTLKNERIYE